MCTYRSQVVAFAKASTRTCLINMYLKKLITVTQVYHALFKTTERDVYGDNFGMFVSLLHNNVKCMKR